MDIVERYEYKFLVEERLVPAIRAFARSTSRLDAYAAADGAYTIRSLYFDTPALDLYAANGREQGHRFKVRVRTYPDALKSPIFLEVKRRAIDVIVKTRGAVEPAAWRLAAQGDAATLASASARQRSAVTTFASLVQAHHLEPVILVQYEREAYVSLVDSYARLTIDRNIRAQSRTTFELDADDRRWRAIDHPAQTNTERPVAVLELKFERRPPAWMHAMVRRLELVRRSFSKYCYGVLNENLLPLGDRTAALAAATAGGWR